jgi:hypothetical protein
LSLIWQIDDFFLYPRKRILPKVPGTWALPGTSAAPGRVYVPGTYTIFPDEILVVLGSCAHPTHTLSLPRGGRGRLSAKMKKPLTTK